MGKSESKKNRKEGFSNKLDKLIQKSQAGETKGIPTGSFVSRFIAEIYQLKIDKEILVKIAESSLAVHFHRYVDDYKFYHNEENRFEDVLHIMHDTYSIYELQINDSKVMQVSYPDQNKDTLDLTIFFDKLQGTFEYILGSDDNNYKKASKIAMYIYRYIELYQCYKKESEIKMPIYFPIKNFIMMLKNNYNGVYLELMKKDLLFEFVNVFLLDMKYLQYFMQFIDEVYLDINHEVIKKVFNSYESIFNDKVQYCYDKVIQVELSYFLTLNLLYPYFKIDEEVLNKIIETSDSVTALLAFKILSRDKLERAVKTSVSKITESKDFLLKRGHKQKDIFSFRNHNFMFEYEVARLYLHEENFKSKMAKDDILLFDERIANLETNSTISTFERFYYEMLKDNVKFILI